MISFYHACFRTSVSDCWKSDAHERPLFPHIIQNLEKVASSDFAATAADSFRSLQESWKAEIERIFGELKEREKVGGFFSIVFSYFSIIMTFEYIAD